MHGSYDMIVTFAGAIFFGILLIVISKKIKVSSIALMLLGGVLLGPSSVGVGIINPSSLGEGLNVIIKLAVGLILFEGGLTLDPQGYRVLSSEIRNVLTRGILITWLGSALVVRLVFGFPWEFSIFAGSLIIVTGPTVINPLLKRIGVKKNIHDFLHWESVLIDPIGVFIALLCYEWIIGDKALLLFVSRLVFGAGIGVISGLILSYIIKKQFIPDEAVNVFILACALAIFTVSDMVIPESGLLSVTVSGFVIGYSETPQIDRLKIYKSQLVDLLIGLLFMLLAANLKLDFMDIQFVMMLMVSVAAVMFIVRPVNIAVSTFGERHFNLRDKLFLSWIAPRGIVAASMASVFALDLTGLQASRYASYAGFLESFTYSVIIATVVFQGFTAKWFGRVLGVLEPEPKGWLIVGAHNLARRAAKFILDRGCPVVLVDTNIRNVNVARRRGFTAIFANALKADIDDYPELYGTGNVLALTKNEDLNELICQRWLMKSKNIRLYKWSSLREGAESEEKSESPIMSVWHTVRMEKVAVISDNESDAVFLTGVTEADRIKHRERILLCFTNERVYPFMPDESKGRVEFLMYRPFDVSLDLQLKPSWIIYSQEQGMRNVIFEMLMTLKEDYPDLDVDKIHDHIMKLESEYSSVIGRNVALPHTYIDNIDDSIVVVSKTVEPITFGDDLEEINLVFLVLSPKNQPDIHIQTLSEISKFIVNEENHKKLMDAASRQDLVAVFFPEKQ